MHRKIAALSAALAVALAAPTANALDVYDLPADLLAFIASVPPTNDFAVGSGRFAKGQRADGFNLSAHGSIVDAHGHVTMKIIGFAEARGEVDCLYVSGRRAAASGELDEPEGEYTHFVVVVEDNGEPSGTNPDQALPVLETPPLGAVDCGLAAALATSPLQPIQQGNIVVKDR